MNLRRGRGFRRQNDDDGGDVPLDIPNRMVREAGRAAVNAAGVAAAAAAEAIRAIQEVAEHEQQPEEGNVDEDVDDDDVEEEEDEEAIEEVDDEGQEDEGGAAQGEPALGQQLQPAAARRRRLPRVQGGAEMVRIDARTLQTLIGALQGQQQQQRQRERVKMLLYDGKSDPEDFLSIMRHLAQT